MGSSSSSSRYRTVAEVPPWSLVAYAASLLFIVIFSFDAVVVCGRRTSSKPSKQTLNEIEKDTSVFAEPPQDSKKTRDNDQPLTRSQLINRLTHYYNRQEPPILDRPTEVKLGIYVNSFYSFNEQTMDFAVSMYLRQAWRDPRLAFSSFNTDIKKIRLGDNSWNEIWIQDSMWHTTDRWKIWIPDTFFRNEKAAAFHEVTVKNRLMTLTANGDLWYVVKISATLSCPMKLQKYPLDTQTCPMMFESFGYTMDTVYFSWLDSPVDIDSGLQLPQFHLEDTVLYDCSQNYTAGAFPCLEIRFVLRRDIGYFLIQVYVPSILIVILSWVSFWINVDASPILLDRPRFLLKRPWLPRQLPVVDASPARVSLGLLTVLTTTTMSGGARASLPRVSYIKAIDVWMIVCLVFVFASLIEYAVVNVLSRRTTRKIDGSRTRTTAVRTALLNRIPVGRRQTSKLPLQTTAVGGTSVRISGVQHGWHGCTIATSTKTDALPLPSGLVSRSPSTTSQQPPVQPQQPPPTAVVKASVEEVDGKYQARRVDKFSRKCFPLSFVIFNLIYWIFYTQSGAQKSGEGSSAS